MLENTANTHTTSPIHVATGVTEVSSVTDSAARLHAELDGIVTRPITDKMCREAMLDCVIRCRGAVGGGWSQVTGDRVSSDVVRLQGAVFERGEVKRWLANLAIRAISERKDLVAECPSVRNLLAISVPVNADRRAERRDHDGEPLEYPGLVLTIVVTNHEKVAVEAELLAAQCVMRAWRDWYSLSTIRQANQHLSGTSALLELTRLVTSAGTRQRANQTLVNELQRHFDARFVALGVRRGRKSTVRLESVSNIGDFDPNAQQSARLEAALSETVIRGTVTQFPAIEASDHHQHLAHKRVAETFGVDSVISVPLICEGDTMIGSILLGGKASELLEPGKRNLLEASSSPVGNAVSVAERLEGGWLHRWGRRITHLLRSNRGKALTLGTLCLSGVMFIPVPYRIACRCKVEPTMRRYSLAPYDGMLENTFVEPGDEVSEGDLLARMEGRELSWELAGVVAEEQRALKERDVHRARMEVARSLISELESEKLAADKTLLNHRLRNLELRSPIDGIILSGSLDRRQNYPVTVGQVVYEIAPTEELRLELAVPAAERRYVSKGMLASVQIDGGGGKTITGKISRILPRSEIRNEQNVFVAEVIVANPNGDLKPGMEGSVRITSDNKPLGWTIGHHAWERLVTTVWW